MIATSPSFLLSMVNWKIKFQLSHTSDLNLLLQGYGVELTSPNIPAWYLFQP